MKPFSRSLLMLGISGGLFAQDPASPQMEAAPAETGIPGPIADGTPAQPLPEKEPVSFKVLSSVTKRVEVSESSELPGLPPVEGTINMRMELVEDPGLPPLEKPLPPQVDVNDPLVQERLQEVRSKFREMKILFVSATVLDYNRTILEVYPNGRMHDRVKVVSSIDFNDFTGFATFNVAGKTAEGSEDEVRQYALIMAIGNEITENMERLAEKSGRTYQPPDLPEIPISNGHNFVVLEGDNAEGLRTIADMHRLYSVEGGRMREARLGRERAYEERKAFLLETPPKPKDVTFRFWKRGSTSGSEPNLK